jgi:hypothetical protein
MDDEMAAMMGITAFGAKKSGRQLDRNRFDKNKREAGSPFNSSLIIYSRCIQEVVPAPAAEAKPAPSAVPEAESDEDTDDDEDLPESSSRADQTRPAPSTAAPSFQEPSYDPDAPELSGPIGTFDGDADDNDATTPFPITHELPLKDHNKVISALALDPSGARVISGSHDYDCKLWDFGGMDSRCKPFRSWEPAGSYYVTFRLTSSVYVY